MSEIKIHDRRQDATISVPCVFLTEYMPKANGEYVKVYLYLLHAIQQGTSMDISALADCLNDTEKDIIRALRYWNQEGLIALSLDGKSEINGVDLLPIAKEAAAPAQTGSDAISASADGTIGRQTASADPAPAVTEPTGQADPAQSVPAAAGSSLPEDPAFALAAVKESAEYSKLLGYIQNYFPNPISSALADNIAHYCSLFRNYDVVDYLYDYCWNETLKKNPEAKTLGNRYVESVAMGWLNDGTTTREAVQAAQKKYREASSALAKLERKVMDELGLPYPPAQVQKEYIARWHGEYQMAEDAILYACRMTIMKCGHHQFDFTDTILSNWSAQGIHTGAEAAQHEKQYKEDRKNERTTTAAAIDQLQNQAQVSNSSTARTSSRFPVKKTAFHNFPQRDTSDEELEALVYHPSRRKKKED